jgi:ketosteroid isomerase-like protein
MIKYLHIALFLCIGIYFTACSSKKTTEVPTHNDIFSLLKADKDFATYSEEKGIKNAYLEFVDSNGVLLRPNSVPIAGADAIDYIIAMQDENYTMTWKPNDAVVAASGELGYTYGTYLLKPSVGDANFYGTYVSIWKKQADGKWKFVLNTSNEGVGEE